MTIACRFVGNEINCQDSPCVACFRPRRRYFNDARNNEVCFTEVKLTIADEISSLFGRGRFVSKYAVSIFLKQINGGLEPTRPVTNIQLLCISLRNVHSRSRSIETFATFVSNILQISSTYVFSFYFVWVFQR